MSRRARWLVGLLMLGSAGGAAGWLVAQAWGLPRRFAVVEPGKLYRAAQPRPQQLERLKDEFGIRTLIIARMEGRESVAAEIKAAQQAGLKVVQLPIQSAHPIPNELMSRFWETLDDPANLPALVHCAAGRHRTGMLCALYRMHRQGWSPAEARAEMVSYWDDKAEHSSSETVMLQQFERYVEQHGWRDDAPVAEPPP